MSHSLPFRHPAMALMNVILVAALGVLGAGTTKASAEETPSGCSPGDAPPAPVLLVHGFLSDPDGGWGTESEGPIQRALEAKGHQVERFDYAELATKWVTNRRIGPRLADAVLALSSEYKKRCGDGKIIMVAHSMGGLAARCALDASCGKREGVPDAVGLIVTLGTPYLGSHLRTATRDLAADLASRYPALLALCAPRIGDLFTQGIREEACRYIDALLVSEAGRAFTLGSSALAELPPFPRQVAVRALAGQVLVPLRTASSVRIYNLGDMVVGFESATAGSTSHSYGGSRVINCGVFPEISCWHGNLTKTQLFVDDVSSTVQGYQDSATKRAQEAAAQAQAAAEAAEQAAAESGVLPAPRGPVMEVTRQVSPFPFEVQGIGMYTPTVQWGDEPAPAGMQWVAVALQFRGLLEDRDMPTPDISSFNFSWKGGCPSNYFDDPYYCNNEDLDRVTHFLPVDASAFDDSRNIPGGGTIPPGQPVDAIYRVLVPEGIDLSTAMIKYFLSSEGPMTLPLNGLPTLG